MDVQESKKREVFLRLCKEDIDKIDEVVGIEQEIGTVEFKLEEASVMVDAMGSEIELFQNEIVPRLVKNAQKLNVLYAKIDLIHNFLVKYQYAVEELDQRLTTIEEAANPIYYAKSVKNMFRSLNLATAGFVKNKQETQVLEEWKPLQPFPDINAYLRDRKAIVTSDLAVNS